MSSSTGGQGAAPIAQAVNASVDMYLSGGGNSRKSWGVGGMFSFEEIAMGLNDVTVHTLQGEEAEGWWLCDSFLLFFATRHKRCA